MELKDYKLDFNKKTFQHGISEYSDMCGVIYALTQLGVSPDKAVDYFIAVAQANAEVECARADMTSVLEQLGITDDSCDCEGEDL